MDEAERREWTEAVNKTARLYEEAYERLEQLEAERSRLIETLALIERAASLILDAGRNGSKARDKGDWSRLNSARIAARMVLDGDASMLRIGKKGDHE